MHSNPSVTPDRPVLVPSPDDTLMIDIDFFDQSGRFNPNTVLFSPRDDARRASSLWTRMFGGLMVLRGKIWAKSYLNTHFGERGTSAVMLSSIRETGQVRKTDFMKTVAECTLRYETLSEAARVNGRGLQLLFSPPQLKNLPQIVFDHIASIDWQNLPYREFPNVTAKMADNICRFVDALEPAPVNDVFVDSLDAFSVKFRQWASNPPVKDAESRQPELGRLDLDSNFGQARDDIADKIAQGITDYRRSRGPVSRGLQSTMQASTPTTMESTPPTEFNSAEAVPLHSVLSAEIKQQRDKRFFQISTLYEMDRCNLVSYLEFGKDVFSTDTDFTMVEKFLSFGERGLKVVLPFLNDAQIQQLHQKFRQLQSELPAIKSELEKKRAEGGADADTDLFADDDIDRDQLERINLSEFDQWQRISEEDLRKILRWVHELDIPSSTPQDEQLVRQLQSMTERLEAWVNDPISGRRQTYPELERAGKLLRNATRQFLDNLEKFRASLEAAKNHYKNKMYKKKI
jgi:hypothetical protein